LILFIFGGENNENIHQDFNLFVGVVHVCARYGILRQKEQKACGQQKAFKQHIGYQSG
jgi:hypothetical protein